MKVLGVVVLLAGTAAFGQGYLRTQVPNSDPALCIFWGDRSYTYHVDSAGSSQTPGDTEFDAIDAAFQTWQTLSDQCSDFQFIRGARVDNPQVGYSSSGDNTNVITFRETSCDDVPADDPCLNDDSCANKYRCWDHDPMIIALTTTTFSTKSGTLYDADIELNAAPQYGGPGLLFTTVSSPPCNYSNISTNCVATDVQNTLTHEIGHVIGLAHVDIPGSTMQPTAPLGETHKRVIDIGTASGFCDIYPRGMPSSSACDLSAQVHDDVRAVSAGTGGCSSAGGAPWAILFLLLLYPSRRWARR